ncbi:uncharacterized protein LOC144362680 [Saccoglossus kowalevskii]
MDKEKQKAVVSNYFGCTKQHTRHLLYDQLFHTTEGYENKRRRDDRTSAHRADVGEEERQRAVPMLTNSIYGKHKPLVKDTPEKKNQRETVIGDKDFYRPNGSNIPFGDAILH